MRIEVVRPVEEGDVVAGRVLCSATHLGACEGHEATGRRFSLIDEVYFFTSPAT